MRDPDNISAVAKLQPDFMGFIFYPRSPRFAGDLQAADLSALSPGTKRVGVFVDPSESEILQYTAKLKLDYIQLHGNETKQFVEHLSGNGIKLIKVISGNKELDVAYMRSVEALVDYWLLDTRTDIPGGTGITFDRSVLNSYAFEKPVLLSGGLDAAEVAEIRKESHPSVAGVDVNSRLEERPGFKNIEKLKIVKRNIV
jgi:phosphoribosylanthranilate isomerase